MMGSEIYAYQPMHSGSFSLHTHCLPKCSQGVLKLDWSILLTTGQYYSLTNCQFVSELTIFPKRFPFVAVHVDHLKKKQELFGLYIQSQRTNFIIQH